MKTPQESEPANRYEATIDYVDSLKATEATLAESQATELLHQRGPLNDHVAIVPVAAHAEPLSNVERTLAQYARQNPLRPFTTVLGLNNPNNERDAERASRLLVQTREIASAHAGLDVRVLHTSYDEPRIGRIRRDLWNTVIMAGLETGMLDETHEMVGMNGDIDLVYMAKHVVADVQRYADAALGGRHGGGQRHVAPPFATPMRHSTLPEYRRSSAFITWRDYLAHIAYIEYEAAIVMPLGRIAACNGINPEARRGEMLDATLAGEAPMHERKLRTGMSVTSGRRLIDRLPHATWETAWEEGSFDAHNAYRKSLDHCTDIRWGRQTKLLFNTAPEAVACILQGATRDARTAAGPGVTDLREYLHVPIMRRLRGTYRVLGELFDEYQTHEMVGRISDELTRVSRASS